MKSFVYLTIWYVSVWCVFGQAKLFPNEIIGSPQVQCGEGSFTINFQTQTSNASRVFAKGFHEVDGCYFMNKNSATFSLSACNMNRKRQIQPRGIQYELTVIVQMHPMFITQVDRAYHVRCFYMEADKLVTAGFNVDPLTTTVIEEGHQMPTCSYSLHKESPNGPAVRYTQVGDQIFHVWQCPSDAYSMLVHSCYVSDNQGAQILVLDENGLVHFTEGTHLCVTNHSIKYRGSSMGEQRKFAVKYCGIDDYVLATPLYNTQLTRAQVQTNVFKFADKIAVSFQCQIKLCLRNGDLCSGLTPPRCSGTTAAPFRTKGDVQTLPSRSQTSRPLENLRSTETGLNEVDKPSTLPPSTTKSLESSTSTVTKTALTLEDVEPTTSSIHSATTSTLDAVTALITEAVNKITSSTQQPQLNHVITSTQTPASPKLVTAAASQVKDSEPKRDRLTEELGSEQLMAITNAVTVSSPILPKLTTTSKRFNGTLIKFTIPATDSIVTPSLAQVTTASSEEVEGSGESTVETPNPVQILGVPKEKPGLLESPELSARQFGRRLADLPVLETDVKTEEVVVLDGDATLRAEFDSTTSNSEARLENLRAEYAAAVARLQDSRKRPQSSQICLSTIGFGFVLFAFILATICSVTVAILFIRHSPDKQRQRLINMTRWQSVNPAFS